MSSTSGQPERIRDLFIAIKQMPQEERAFVMDRECAGDPDLRAELESLLAHDSDTHGVLDHPIGDVHRFVNRSLTGQLKGARLGQYEILRPIGQGGMGRVYEALQSHPRRHVALKVIDAMLCSPDMLRRFEFEAEVLGRLQHPCIAQIYEAGTCNTDAGAQPFIAMELIHGLPLSEYAAMRPLDVEDKLKLIIKLCHAVQHAHQKGIIHRDLKPGNILVTENGEPVILDFGVARAIDADLFMTTLHTSMGQVLGTIPYMSPEQASGTPEALDTRSDVYALGVICYELLTGRLPYELKYKQLHEALLTIQQRTPAPMRSFDKGLRGDLETVVAKAMEKDKARRYQSVEELGSDLERFLRDEPIIARPASAWYQFRKFARRNRLQVGAAAVVVVILAIGVLMSVRAWQSEANQRRSAESIYEFLTEDVLLALDPYDNPGVSNVSAALDRASKAIDARFQHDPGINGSIRATLGAVYCNIGKFDQAEHHLRAAEAILSKHLGADAPETIDVLKNRGHLFREQSRFDESNELLQRSLLASLRFLGTQHPTTLGVMNELGHLRLEQGQDQEGEEYFRKAYEGRRRVLGAEHRDTLESMVNLADSLRRLMRSDEAKTLFEQAIAAFQRAGSQDDPMMLAAQNNLAVLHFGRGDWAKAENLFATILRTHERVFGPVHRSTLVSLNNLGWVYRTEGKLDEAQTLLERAFEERQRALGDGHKDTWEAMHNLAVLYLDLGERDRAFGLMQNALERRSISLGPDHPETLVSSADFALFLSEENEHEKAEPWFRRTLDGARRSLPYGHETARKATYNFAMSLSALQRYDEAIELLESLVAMERHVSASETADLAWSINTLARTCELKGNYSAAEVNYREGLAMRQRVLGTDHPLVALSQSNLANVLRTASRYTEAESMLRDALAIRLKQLPQDDALIAQTRRSLGEILCKMGSYTEAESMLINAYAFYESLDEAEEAQKLSQEVIRMYETWDAAVPDPGCAIKLQQWRDRLTARSEGDRSD